MCAKLYGPPIQYGFITIPIAMYKVSGFHQIKSLTNHNNFDISNHVMTRHCCTNVMDVI